jgi:hypothetical protein
MDNIITTTAEFEENKDQQKYRLKKGITGLLVSNEPSGQYKKFRYAVVCSECKKVYQYIVDSEQELESLLSQEGWRSQISDSEIYCPKCVQKAIKEELNGRRTKSS